MMASARRALLLDLDNTLIHTKSGEKFPIDRDDWTFMYGMPEKIKEYDRNGYTIFIVSNQGGIESGNPTIKDFTYKIKDIRRKLADSYGVAIKDVYYCTTEDDNHLHRKPNPGMAFSIATEYNVNLMTSIMVGDASGKPGSWSDSDKKFAENAGIGIFQDPLDFLNTNIEDNII